MPARQKLCSLELSSSRARSTVSSNDAAAWAAREAERAEAAPNPTEALEQKKVHWKEAEREAVLCVPKAKAKTHLTVNCHFI